MTDSVTTGTLRLPPRVHVGFGARAQLLHTLPDGTQRVLAVIDPFLTTSPLWVELQTSLEAHGVRVHVHSDIRPELPVDSLTAAADTAAALGVQAIIAAGGGSALDAAKLVALLVTHGGPLSRFYGENLVPGPVLPVIALPTTAGTGSEVTPVAVVSDPRRHMKVGISSPHLIPAAALVDPELTLAAPASVTAFAGVDALVHAVESFTAADLQSAWNDELPVFTGRNTLTSALALEAARRIRAWLPVAVREPANRRAREEMAIGSLQAGIAFGPTGTHLSHALQYPIGAATGTPHGLGTGLLLPYVVDALRRHPATAERIGVLGDAMGVGADPDAVIAALRDLNDAIGVPSSLRDLGIEREQLPQIAELALESRRLVDIAPVPVGEDLLQEILESAFAGTLALRRTA